MELLEAIKSRKSIRAFKPDPVPKDVLTELLDGARWSPSSANTQPWEFFVLVYFPDEVRRIANIPESSKSLSGLLLDTRIGIIRLIACGPNESLLRNWLHGMGLPKKGRRKRHEEVTRSELQL